MSFTKAGAATIRDFVSYVEAVPVSTDFAVGGALDAIRKDRQSSLNQIVGAVAGIEHEMLEMAAKVAEDYAEEIKHTAHYDGLGMGWQAGENLSVDIAQRIRRLARQGGEHADQTR